MSLRPAIHVEHLYKQYRLHDPAARHTTLRDAIVGTVRRPFGARRKHAARFWALDDINFDVMPGDTVGIIGRNGAGKSTLLKVLARITDPTRGLVELRGRIGSLLEVGTGFHLELTGRENTYLSGAILGMRRHEIRERFDEIVAFAEVDKFIDTPVKHYSSGMRLRLAFAVAAHLHPEILLIDEILAVGDAKFQRKCLGKMEDVAAAGRTVLFVSHNLGAVKELCQTGVVLSHGHQVFHGSVVEAIARYSKSIIDADADADSREGLRELALETCGDDADWRVRPDEPLDFRATMELDDQLSRGRLFCIINDSSGGMIVHQRVELSELADAGIGPGCFAVHVGLPPLWLAPGIYNVHMKFMGTTSNGKDLKYTSEHRTLDVTGWSNDRGRAYLAPSAEWSLTPQELLTPDAVNSLGASGRGLATRSSESVAR